MNKDEIKKALERCLSNDCDNCPYYDDDECRDILIDAALTLITKQEKEIERLKTTLGQCNTELNSALESLKSQCREIGELKAEVKQAKIDVLNELKTKAFDKDAFNGWAGSTFVVLVRDIDKMIEELTKCRR